MSWPKRCELGEDGSDTHLPCSGVVEGERLSLYPLRPIAGEENRPQSHESVGELSLSPPGAILGRLGPTPCLGSKYSPAGMGAGEPALREREQSSCLLLDVVLGELAGAVVNSLP